MMKYKQSILPMLMVFAMTSTIGLSAEDINKKEIISSSTQKSTMKTAGLFTPDDNFPKSYFLITKNLPFMVALTLHHPMSASLNLTDEQQEQIKKIKSKTVPKVKAKAKKIKEKELFLAQAFIDGANVSDMEKLVDEISVLRTDLTKTHLVCIDKVRSILTPKQFKTLQGYAPKSYAPNKPKK